MTQDGSSRSRGRRSVIQSKLAAPPLSERLVPRPRVSGLLAGIVEAHPLVWVCATAGSGKTTAVVEATAALGRPVAWLTLDDTDAAPGRLLTYLEAALARQVPAAADAASTALAAGIPHAEAAGLLAETGTGVPLVLVVDELERLADAPDALTVLAAFVRYAPPTMRVVLVSRVDVQLDLGAAGALGRAAAIGEGALAFTADEAAQALERGGIDTVDPAHAVEVTGGWVTGVLFEAWRSTEHIPGSGGEADPLYGYLATQILDHLDPADRDFLEATSLLDEVTPARAQALGQSGAGERLVALRARHLPVAWQPDGLGMRCHPRFREYLLERLERRDDLPALRRAYGDLLMAERHHEDAAEQYLRVGELQCALPAVEAVAEAVVERLDFAVAERLLDAVAPVAPPLGPLTVAELMLAIGGEDYRRGGRVGDRLQAAGERERLARTSAMAASLLAWCYWHLGRDDDARAVIAVAEPSPEIDAIHYLLRLVDHTGSPVPREGPPLYGGPLDALVRRVNYAHGLIREAGQRPESSWAEAVTTPWRVGSLRASGRTREALDLYRAHPQAWAPAWMHGIVGPELIIDVGDVAEARDLLLRGREHIRASGSVVFDLLNRMIEAKLELRLCDDPDAALQILDSVAAEPLGRRYGFIAEQADTWRGLALLMRSPGAEALAPLERAVALMRTSGRIIELPTAAILLAEARWRACDEDGADAAADLALEAATALGSNHHLLMALADFPAVAARRLDAEAGADSSWHEIGRALMAQGAAIDLHARTHIRLEEFGAARIVVDGAEVRPRIAKSVALLAHLAAAPGHVADRDRLLDALFGGRADESARAYLRQAVHRLREVLPDGVGPVLQGPAVAFEVEVDLRSESAELMGRLREAARLQDAERLEALLDALAIADRGEYLPGVPAPWVDERRERLIEQAGKARVEAAQLAFAAGRYRQAEALAEAALAADPFRESAWRLVMRIAAVTGDDDRVIAAYRRCRSALGLLGAEPSPSTTQLLVALRR